MFGPKDIIVTTPKANHLQAKAEARQAIAWPGAYYFNHFERKPKGVQRGSRCYYVDMDYIRGFAVIDRVTHINAQGQIQAKRLGKDYRIGHYIWMPANSWCWIVPIPHLGFEGFQYADIPRTVKIIGHWRDPEPSIPRPKTHVKAFPRTITRPNW